MRVMVSNTLEEMLVAESVGQESIYGIWHVRQFSYDTLSIILAGFDFFFINGRKGNRKGRKNWNWRHLCFFIVVVCRRLEESENL